MYYRPRNVLFLINKFWGKFLFYFCVLEIIISTQRKALEHCSNILKMTIFVWWSIEK
jgi:hypothetical protein